MKQAVLIIHGVGEQRPMSTIRSFVSSLVGDNKFRSKPDKMSNSLELRKLTHRTDKLDTDFYEYYWAYRFRGTKYSHLISWMKDLLLSKYIPKRLKKYKYIILAIPLITLFFYYFFDDLLECFFDSENVEQFISTIQWVSSIGVFTLILVSVGSLIIKYAGDAARYFNSSPDNIAERQLIKMDGIEIIKSLHEMKNGKGEDKYDKIIIVGHSLGSVIGYDIIKHYWVELNKKIYFKRVALNPVKGELQKSALELLEDSGNLLCQQFELNKKDEIKSKNINFQNNQTTFWKGQDFKKSHWKISDFITLGSPLNYADFFLAKSKEEFEERAKQREFPLCPPTDSNFDEDNLVNRKYTYKSKKEGLENLHHSAVFALTKWTNIYYEGDIIGGELGPLFGFGIKDIKVEIQGTKFHEKMSSHTKYWDSFEDNKNEALQELKKIVLNTK